ncbi:MAG: Serine/threonine protein kinaserelated protein [Planctomycetaceae bacterium]|nr:Serine/threonine protein kinaserelated protein [Planctomycetaceae bacterium]
MNPSQIGPYEILSKIGSGGMGSVYLGRHRETGDEAAVKVLPATLAREEGFVERFNREIDSMKKLSSPHIVKLFDSGVDDGTYYYSMEYVEGETLTQLLRRERRISWESAIDFGVQICYALKAAHDAGIIHRDLKPSNLLLTADGTMKLTDFGVAQVFATDRLTVTGGIVGTAEFMSPEQAEGKRASKQSDLYSLGAVLYAMVCGRPPFTGNTALEVLKKHQYGLFDAPRLVNPDIPSWFEDIVKQLLNKDPAKRFPDAYVVARRLEQVRKKMQVFESETASGAPNPESETITASSGGRGAHDGPGPATLMKSLIRQELEQADAHPFLTSLLNSTWFLVGMLILIVLGGFLWFKDWSPSPEERFKLGEALLSRPAGEEWLQARDKYFLPLVQADSARWKDQVAPYLLQIESYEQLTVLKRDLRKSRIRKGDDGAAANEPRRLLLMALAQQEAGEGLRATQTVLAVKSLLAGDPEQAKLYDLCDRLLVELQPPEKESDERYAWVQAALVRADKQAAAGKVADAQAIWQSIMQLYGQDPAARKFVIQAQDALAQKAKPGS